MATIDESKWVEVECGKATFPKPEFATVNEAIAKFAKGTFGKVEFAKAKFTEAMFAKATFVEANFAAT